MKSTSILLGAALVGAYMLFSNKGTTPQKEQGTASSSVPLNPYGITAENTTQENLDAANAAIAQGIITPNVQDIYKNEISAASSSGRAIVVPASSKTNGKEIVVGPTGNIYFTDPTTGKGTYIPGPNQTSLKQGSGLISSSGGSSSSSLASRQAAIKASITKALTGPKVSAKGKYKAV